MLKSLPNLLTVIRIIIIPFIIGLLYLEPTKNTYFFSALLFVIASITDFFDGYLARILSVESYLGRLLDPIADKLLVVSVIIMLIHLGRVDLLPAFAIICREMIVSGLREFLAGLMVSMPVSRLAKIKTAAQMVALPLILWGNKGSGYVFVDDLGRIFLWLSAVLTLITGYAYLKAALKYIYEHELNGQDKN